MDRIWLAKKIPGEKNEKGVVAIEFALVLPLLLILLFGIIEFGIILYDKAMVTNASREGARAGIVFRSDLPLNYLDRPAIIDVVKEYCGDNLLVPADRVVYLIEWGKLNPDKLPTVDPRWFETFECNEDEELTEPNSGNYVRVKVEYQYGFLILPNFVEMVTGPITLTATTVMRME